MIDPQRNPHLIDAEAWATEHRALLAACYERFHRDGEWPTLEQLQHDFELAGRKEDVSRLAFGMPRPLGFVEQQRLVLLVRALSHVPKAAPLLEDWCVVLKLAYNKWRNDPTAELTRADVLQLLDGDPQRMRFAALLFLRERWAFGSGRGGIDDEWSQEIISAVRDAREARGPAEIIAVRDRTEFPSPHSADDEEKEAVPGRSVLGWLRSFGGTAYDHPFWTTVAAGLTVLVIWAIVKWGYSDIFGSDAGAPSGGQGVTREESEPAPVASALGSRWEEAGEDGATTFRNPKTLSQPGPRVPTGRKVLVSCRLYSPEPESVNPDGYWYRLASAPWGGHYYAPANSFWNGDVPGQTPYTHNTDFEVRKC